VLQGAVNLELTLTLARRTSVCFASLTKTEMSGAIFISNYRREKNEKRQKSCILLGLSMMQTTEAHGIVRESQDITIIQTGYENDHVNFLSSELEHYSNENCNFCIVHNF